MARMQWRMGNIVIGLALLLGFSPALAEPTFPALTGRVVDNANLLDPADEQRSPPISRRSRTRAPTR
jgi:uncharacterized protein